MTSFICKWAKMPDDKVMIAEINNAAKRIYDKLMQGGLNAPKDMDPDYRNIYYKNHLESLKNDLSKYIYHLTWAIAGTKKHRKEITLIDHGGGLGFMSILAKEAGVGKVIYNDIDYKFMQAAASIGTSVNAAADHYILGDVDTLIKEHERSIRTTVDALVSYDVLEHIYDLDFFFEKLCLSKCCPNLIFSSSGANMFNPRFIYNVLPIQARRDFIYRCKRINIINKCAQHLSDKEIVKMTKNSRLLIRKDIEEMVRHYSQTKDMRIPKLTVANLYDPFRFNTVDPETGWWAEHLINPYYFIKILNRYGFKTKIMAGPYRRLGSFINPIIRAIGMPLACLWLYQSPNIIPFTPGRLS